MSARDQLAGELLGVLAVASNFPERAQVRLLGQDMRPLAEKCSDAIIAAGWRPPARTVTTAEERAAVRRGTVVRSASGTIACRHDKWNAVSLGVGAPFDWTVLALPLTVIYEPEEGE